MGVDNPVSILLAPRRWLSPAQTGTLRANAEALTSHYDVYRTLRELPGLARGDNAGMAEVWRVSGIVGLVVAIGGEGCEVFQVS